MGEIVGFSRLEILEEKEKKKKKSQKASVALRGDEKNPMKKTEFTRVCERLYRIAK